MILTVDPELVESVARMDRTMNLLALVCFGYAAYIIVRAIKKIIKKIFRK